MKTIFHLIVILAVTAIIAGGIYSIVENTSATSSSAPSESQSPALTDSNGQFVPPDGERPEGRESASLTGGLGGVLLLLAKVAGITVIVTWIEQRLTRPQKFPAPRMAS